MTKKKLTTLIMLIAVVALTLTACSGGGNEKKENANATKTEETAKTEEATGTGDITAEGLMETKGGFMSVATGGTGGTYYPLGGALSNILNNAGVNYTATAQATGASKENVELVTREDAEIAFIQNDVAYYAVNGTDTLKEKRNLALEDYAVYILKSYKS